MTSSRAAAAAFAAALLLGCDGTTGTDATADGPVGPGPARADVDERRPARSAAKVPTLKRRVEALSTRQLAHRLQVVTVEGTAARTVTSSEAAANRADFGVPTPAAVARSWQPGGVVYFDANVTSVAQVRSLSAGVHQASRRGGWPILLFADQEGGLVSRLPGPAAVGQPAARTFGGRPAAGAASARGVGAAMAAMGLDANFAPLADVDTVGGQGVIGDRAFGTGPDGVSRLVRAQSCGYHRGGVGVTLKHWPGHGSTSVDSHRSLPTLTLPPRQWRRNHLPPFRAGIRGGADLVMTGHLAYPRLDPSGRPATLSRRLTTSWLRQRLGFEGVIVTDSLGMGAIVSRGTSGEIAARALRAGADLLLMSPSPQGATSGIVEAVRDGRLTRERLEESALRALRLADATGLVPGARQLNRC